MQALIRFINHEATAGFILVVAAIAALIISNDPTLHRIASFPDAA